MGMSFSISLNIQAWRFNSHPPTCIMLDTPMLSFTHSFLCWWNAVRCLANTMRLSTKNTPISGSNLLPSLLKPKWGKAFAFQSQPKRVIFSSARWHQNQHTISEYSLPYVCLFLLPEIFFLVSFPFVNVFFLHWQERLTMRVFPLLQWTNCLKKRTRMVMWVLRTVPFSQPFRPYLAYVIWTLAATSRFIPTLSQRKQHVEKCQCATQFDYQGLDSFSLFSLLRLWWRLGSFMILTHLVFRQVVVMMEIGYWAGGVFPFYSSIIFMS